MSAPHVSRVLFASAVLLWLLVFPVLSAANPNSPQPAPESDTLEKVELFDGVSVKIPNDANATDKVMSFEIDTSRSVETGRKKSQKKLMERILPMFIMPFLIQSTIVPFFLSMLKFMLLKSMMVGKMALALIIFNAFRNHNSVKGRDSEMADVHYGYHGNGMEEYGAYFNSR